MADKPRWKLQIFWQGAWRTILEGDDRKPLVEYAQSCPDTVELRITDTLEEVKTHGRRNKP